MVKLTVKTTAGRTFDVDVALEGTVADCKRALVGPTEVPEAQQRLIYKGKVLKDELTLASYGIEADQTIFFVKGSANPRPTSAAAPTTTATAATATTTPPAGTATNPPPAANPFAFPLIPPPAGAEAAPGAGFGAAAGGANPFGNMGGAGMPSMASMQQQMMQNPEMMRQMMDSPMVQALLSNPEIMRSMMQSNPAVQQLLETNPQLTHILNDPELLRQSMEAMRNPNAMRELMRNQDTALRNIESHPEGFNALRRMYHDVQEPLMDAATSGARPPQQAFTMPGLAGGTSTDPAGSNPASQTSATATSAAASNPWASMGGASATGASNAPAANPWAAMGTGMPGMGGGMAPGNAAGVPNPEMLAQLMQSPLMQPMIDQITSNPQMFLSQMEAMNPQMAAMLNANPQMRQMMSNPDVLRQMLNPQNMQAMMQMQSAMNQLRGTGLIPGMGQMNMGAGAPANTSAAPGAPNPMDLSALFGAAPAATGPPPNPEVLYASQLAQLEDMGFSNREQNLRALQATHGNVHAAVERILGGLA